MATNPGLITPDAKGRRDRLVRAPTRSQLQLFDAGPPRLESEDAKALARALAEATPPALRIACAQSLCATAITRYWARRHERRGRDLPSAPATKPVEREGLDLAVAIGDAAAEATVDEAAYLIGSTYAAMLPADFRSRHGVFYTPPGVVRRLLDAAADAGVDWSTCRAIDPACGGGAFLGPVAARMVGALPGCDRRVVVRNVAGRLRGYELDPFAAWMSRVFLNATLFEALGGSVVNVDAIDVCDSLTRHEQGDFDLVIGNPPYGRVTLSPTQRAVYKRGLYGHANLYGVFLDLAIRKAKEHGVIAYVTPTSFLSGEYFKQLRALLGESANPVSLDFVAERAGVFEDVLQETLLAVFRRNNPARRPQINFVEAAGTSVNAVQAGRVPLPESTGDPWLLPRSPDAVPLVRVLGAMPDRLATWGYRVSTGPLVWNRYKDQLRQSPVAGSVPLVWAEAVNADGSFSFRASRRNHAPYFVVRAPDKWLLVKRPCVLLQRTTSKEQLRRLIAAELPGAFVAEHGAVTVENHLNMLLPITDAPRVETSTLAAFLNSGAADRSFRCISGSVAVSAYELESLPLPPPERMDALTKIVRRGGPRSEVERFCDRLYRAV